jgi:acyl-CoA synthetase (AMP-forming)/AMP-acid ligase II
MNISDYLLEVGKDNDPAIITEDGQFTYRDLRNATARIIEVLQENGITSTNRVGLLSTNSLFWVAAYLGILKSGAVAVPFPTLSMPDEIKAYREFVGCKVTLMQQRFYGKYEGAFNDGSPLIFDDCLNKPPGKPLEDYLVAADFDDYQEAVLMFTSGTTQKPRAVRISHHNIRANTDAIIEYLALTNEERIMVVLPFYYCFGTSLLHTHLRAGGSIVLSNTFTFPESVLDMMQSHHCTGFAGVPSTYQTLIRNPSLPRRKMESLKKVQQAGGKLPTVQIEELIDILPGVQIFVMYGATEATARLSYLPPSMLNEKMGSIGKGIPGVELKVLNEAGEPVNPGEVGEIVAWGENIAMGYLNNPEATAEKFIDGAYYTGDLATVDEDGYMYIVDRKADFIKSYGHRVSSQQVEACILELEDVVSAAAIGEPDLLRGEAIVVFVTLRAGSPLTTEDIFSHCRHKLSRHMVPKTIEILDSLPLNSQGKVLKSELRKRVVTAAS